MIGRNKIYETIILTNYKRPKNMETIIYNLIILDESGSMITIKHQAISGFNETVQTIQLAEEKHPEQKHRVSLVTFNGDATKTVYDKIPAKEVVELNSTTYCPSSLTPLYDAMGISLTSLKQFVKPNDKVLVTIITDGYENHSQEYTEQAVKSLVDELKAKGWVFTYIGANQDVKKVAATISVTNVMHFEASEKGTKTMFAKENKARKRFFDRISLGKIFDDSFFDDDEKEV